MPAHGDPALDTLLQPLRDGLLAWPAGGGLFLGARDGWALHQQPLPGLACAQAFKPAVDALRRSGLPVVDPDGRRWPLLLLLPPRQRDAARGMLVRALDHLEPGGRILACMANDEGAKSGQADLARLAGPLQVSTRNHCRVYWSGPLDGPVDIALARQWRDADAPSPILDGRFRSRPGVFAWDRIDPASALLVAHLPGDLAGRGADLGCGYGYLASEVLARCPGVTALDLYEADARALALARDNLADAPSRVALDYRWHDVATGIDAGYDFIVSNPPFHAQGRAEQPDLGRRFIGAAAQALRPGGQLWLVANRHLPYESMLDASFGTVRIVAQRDGFKVVHATRASR